VRVAAGTAVSKRRLPWARVLARSLHERHPEIPFVVLLADAVEGEFDRRAEPFEVVPIAELGGGHRELAFSYEAQPLSFAATPLLLSLLLDRGYEAAVFLKQETLVVGSLAPVLGPLEHSPIVLTPHLTAPLEGADRKERELNVLLSGTYNGGVVGVRDAPSGRAFLRWWADRLWRHCVHAVDRGMHFEQRWLDLVPSLFPGTHAVRDPGANVGHWSLPQHAIEVDGDRVTVDGRPLSLFRFSGFDPDRPDRVTTYSDRLSIRESGGAAVLLERCRAALAAEGLEEARSWSYAFADFDNGVPIPAVARDAYREMKDGARQFGDPFATEAPSSYFAWLGEHVDGGAPAVTRLEDLVYRARPDVQRAFPDHLATGREGFAAWVRSSGAREHGLPDALLAASTAVSRA
jgi:hypothetical protein